MTVRRGRVNRIRTSGGITSLTGDVVGGPGTGSVETIIPVNTVTYPQLQDVTAANRLLGRGSDGGAGDPQEITFGTGLQMVGTQLSATAFSGAAFTYDAELQAFVTPR